MQYCHADGAEIFFQQFVQAELHGNAAVVHFVNDQYVFAFQGIWNGIKPLDFFYFLGYLTFAIAVVVGCGDGVNWNFQEAA